MQDTQKQTLAPKVVMNLLTRHMCFPLGKAYGQISSVDELYAPHTCTVHWHAFPDLGVLGFNTHQKSDKISRLKNNPALSGCYWNAEQGFQMRWRAQGDLSQKLISENMRMDLWMSLRPQVRRAYWLCELDLPLDIKMLPSLDLETVPSQFMTVLCRVNSWDIFWDASSNPDSEYRFGQRLRYDWKQNQWVEQHINHVHSQIIA
ncbi:MAG: hypothetical protein KDD52_00600 [Bdellovibrionales bacterium]|nr:hypothetical protein [Bdellovibrionales bacterium]